MKKILYFVYYIKELDYITFKRFLRFVSKLMSKNSASILSDVIYSSFAYNISLLDYFYFRFFQLDKQGRSLWAGTGFMYEYQLVMNPKQYRHLLEDKIKFLYNYKAYVKRNFADIKSLKSNHAKVEELLNNPSGKIVLKLSTGQVGANVKVYSREEIKPSMLVKEMERKGFDLAEEYVVQHPALMALSPSGLNTVRIFTQLDAQGNVVYLGARLRISVDSPVDNMGAGNLATPVNINTGFTSGAGVYSDITKREETIHPVTGQPIEGFQVPFWQETMDMVKQAALDFPQNRSIGWDVAITENGPELIEGNHNWCKLLWQLPVKQGLKLLLLPFMEESRKTYFWSRKIDPDRISY